MKQNVKMTNDALVILDELFFKDDPDAPRMLEEVRVDTEIADQIYKLRTAQGLSQRELAKRVGTSASTISRIENSCYGRHSLTTLKRIAWALDQRLVVRFEPLEEGVKSAEAESPEEPPATKPRAASR